MRAGAGDAIASKNNCERKQTFEPEVCKYKMHPTKSALRNGSDQPLKLKQLQPTAPLGWVRAHGLQITTQTQIQIQIQTQIQVQIQIQIQIQILNRDSSVDKFSVSE